MRWLIILAIIIGVYFLFFRKKNPGKEHFYDPIAEEIFKKYEPNKEITRYRNPKTHNMVLVTHRSMKHILERHHPDYPPDAKKGKGSLFPPKTTVQEINDGIETILKIGVLHPNQKSKDNESNSTKYYVVYQGNTTIHNKRALYRLVVNQPPNQLENVVTFFPVDSNR